MGKTPGISWDGVIREGLPELRPGEQDGASDDQGWARNPEHQRGVHSSEGPGLYPKSHEKGLDGFFPFFEGSDMVLLYFTS